MRWHKIECGRLEAELAKADPAFQRMTSFLATLPLPAYVKDRKGRFLFLNAAAENLWKVPARQVIGKTKAELLNDPRIQAETIENDRKVLRSAAAHVMIDLTPAGRIRHVTLEFSFQDAAGDRVLAGIMGR